LHQPIKIILMNSIFKTITIHKVDCGDLSDLIQNLYGRNPEIEASLELGHDDDYAISACADEADENEFAKWKEKPSFSTSEIYMLMNQLAKDGHIVDGDYLIQTC